MQCLGTTPSRFPRYRGDTSAALDGSNAYLAVAAVGVAPRVPRPGAQLYVVVAASTSTNPRENCGESCVPKSRYVPTQLNKMATEVANCHAARERRVSMARRESGALGTAQVAARRGARVGAT